MRGHAPRCANHAAQTPADAPSRAAAAKAATPATARPKRARTAIVPTPIPTPAESMQDMSRATAALYLAAAAGVMPTPPDFSKPSYACERKRLSRPREARGGGRRSGPARLRLPDFLFRSTGA